MAGYLLMVKTCPPERREKMEALEVDTHKSYKIQKAHQIMTLMESLLKVI